MSAKQVQPRATASSATYGEQRRRQLSRSRMLATGLLGAMGAGYVGTHLVPEPGFGVLLTRAGAEAGLVGGLADWFAVTALFRHPLGLPIPHTAIIPSNKERIGQALSRFVEQNFLTRELLVRKVREAEVGRRTARWLAAPTTAPTIAGWVVTALPPLIRALENPELREFADRALGNQLRGANLAPALAHLLRILTGSGEADALFDSMLDVALRWLADNKVQIFDLVKERSRWWIPKAVNRRIAEAIIDGVTELFEGLKQPEGEARVRFRAALIRLIEELVSSPERREQINRAKDRLLVHPEVRAWLGSIWKEVSQSALRDLEQPKSTTRRTLEEAITSIARVLAQDASMIANLDAAAERIALIMVTQRHNIANVIDEVVRSWDTATLTDRLELAVGSDLQYIRMNGTLVGAAVGCLIFVLSRLAGWPN
jgi:uncharacterized membrane-anchored protein YjiN (DUF445 family)